MSGAPIEERPMRRSRTKRIVLTALAVIAAAVLVPIALNTLHYATTPDFATYLREHPVSAASLAERLPGTEPLSENEAWTTGSTDPFAATAGETRELWEGRQSIVVRRGDEVLARARIHVALTSPDGQDRDGYGVRVEELSSARELRSILVVGVDSPAAVVGADSAGRGVVRFDLIVAAGEGADRYLVVGEHDPHPLPPPGSGSPGALSLLASALFPIGGPPDSGWLLHVRDTIHTSARDVEGGSHGAGTGFVQFEASTGEYSFGYEVESVMSGSSGAGLTSTERRSHERRWNGRLW